jgi:hypothetical protein
VIAVILLAVGAVFAGLFLLNNLLKAILRRPRVTFLDLLLAFLSVGVIAFAVSYAYAEALPDPNSSDYVPFASTVDPLIQNAALIAAGVLIAFSLIIMLIEAFRPQRLRGSRGLLGLFGGVLLAIIAVSVPLLSIFLESSALEAETPQVAAAATQSPDAESTAEFTDADRARAEQLFKAIRDVLAEEIDADEVAVFTQLDNGKPLAEIVAENGGDVERVIDRLTVIMREAIRESAERGEIPAFQAGIFVSQMELFIRLAVNSDLNTFGQRFSSAPTATGTRQSLLSLLTSEPTNTPNAQATVAPTATITPSPTLTATSLPSATPAPSNTPVPTLTPTQERTRFTTRTPEPTATQVTPCLASVNFNLRLRAAPSGDADTLLVIPFATTIELYARNSDGLWWQAIYEGQTGWVDGQYLTLSAACERLPIR